jgi:hypothetical protein
LRPRAEAAKTHHKLIDGDVFGQVLRVEVVRLLLELRPFLLQSLEEVFWLQGLGSLGLIMAGSSNRGGRRRFRGGGEGLSEQNGQRRRRAERRGNE